MDQNEWNVFCDEIDQAWQSGNYDHARLLLQKIAYSMVGSDITQEQKNQFTQVMKDFASDDPLYREIMAIVVPFVAANPGVMQSKIYSELPQWTQEEVRYALYFAHELGHIQRVKKGNSYKLLPSGYTGA